MGGPDVSGPDPHDDAGDGLTGDAADGSHDAGPDGEAPSDSTDASIAADGDSTPPPPGLTNRPCELTLSYAPPGADPGQVRLASSIYGWADDPKSFTKDADGVYHLTLDVSEVAQGAYGYKLILGADEWILDPANKMRRFDDGTVNSRLVVPDCHVPLLTVHAQDIDIAARTASLEVQVWRGLGGELTLAPPPTVTHGFEPLAGTWDAERGTLRIDVSELSDGKQTFRFDAAGPAGSAEPLAISFWIEDEPFDWRDAVLYFAFTDRFRDEDPTGEPAACLSSDSLANWQGGDWPGITAAIEEGYFTDLGVNALWLNSPMDNPDGCDPGLFGKTYTAYHAYFPSNLDQTEGHFGSMEDLRDLVSAAHARGIRVLVDYTANHVYETAPEYAQHQADGWFNFDGLCRDQNWEPPETCWFETYLPDIDYTNDDAVQRMTDVAVDWALDADLDGFRVDAVKHMHRHVLYALRARLDRIEATSDQPLYTVGETFTGGWEGDDGGAGAALIKSYVGSDQLYGQFDFPLYWPILGAFAVEDTGLDWLGQVLESTASYYGSEALMASFLGNHDVARFVTIAAGQVPSQCPDGSESVGYDCPPGQPDFAEPYQRLIRAFTFLAAAPPIPLIYYGDEIGLAGAGDPDNRRNMEWGPISDDRTAVRAAVEALMQARRGSLSLRRGDLQITESSSDHLVFTRSAPGSHAVAAFNLGAAERTVTVGAAAGATYTDAVSGALLEPAAGSLTAVIPARSARLLTTAD